MNFKVLVVRRTELVLQFLTKIGVGFAEVRAVDVVQPHHTANGKTEDDMRERGFAYR